jgi:glycosyltransferase involved in cell wall biosynthesis
MRVVLLSGAYAPNRWCGAAVAAEQTAAELRAAGHQVVVATAMPGAPGDLQRWQSGGVPVIGVAVTPPGSAARHPPTVVQAGLTQMLAAVRPDVVHVHSWRLFGEGAAAAVTHAGLPTVLTLTGTDPEPPGGLLTSASCVVAPDTEQASRVSTLPADRLRTIRHGVAGPGPESRRAGRSGPLRLGYVGGIDEERGYRVLLAALSELGRTDYELHAVDRAALRGVRSLRDWDFLIPGLVKLVPGYTAAGRDAFYNSIDVLLHLPQQPGSTGLGVSEARLRGVWPITTLGPAAAIRDHVDGTSIAAGSVEALADAVAWALDHAATVRAVPPATGLPTIAAETEALLEVYASATL